MVLDSSTGALCGGSSQRSLNVRGGRGRDMLDVFGISTHEFGRSHSRLDDRRDARHAGHNSVVATLFEAADWSGGGAERYVRQFGCGRYCTW